MVQRDFVVRARAETADAVRGLSRLQRVSDSTGKAISGLGGSASKALSGFKQYQRELDKAQRGQKQFGASAEGAAGSFGRLAIQAAKGAAVFLGVRTSISSVGQALEQGQAFIALERGFESLQERAGLLADVSLQKLRQASLGLASDMQLLEQANLAMTLGLDPERFDQVAAAAIKLGRSVGLNVARSLDSVTVAIGRQSTRVLDNLGVVLQADSAYQELAKSLGKTTDQLTFQDKAIFEINQKAKQLAEFPINAGEAFVQLTSTMANLRAEYAMVIAENTELGRALQRLGETLKKVDIDAYARGVAELAAQFIRLTDNVLAALQVMNIIKEGPPNLGSFVTQVGEASKSMESLNRIQATTEKQFKQIEGRVVELATQAKALENILADYENRRVLSRDLEPASISKAREMLKGVNSELMQIAPELTIAGEKLKFINKVVKEAPERFKNAKRGAKDLGDEIGETEKKTKDLTSELARMIKQFESKQLGKSIEEAIASQDRASFDRLKEKLVQAELEAHLLAYEKFIKDPKLKATAEAFAQIQADMAGIELTDKYEDVTEKLKEDSIRAHEEAAQAAQDELERAYDEATDVFADLLSAAIEGDIASALERMLKNAAIDFASDIFRSMISQQGGGQGGGLGGIFNMVGGQGGGFNGGLLNNISGLFSGGGASTMSAAQAGALSGQSAGVTGAIGAGSGVSAGTQAAIAGGELLPGAAGSMGQSQAAAGSALYSGAGSSALTTLGWIGTAYNVATSLKDIGKNTKATATAVGATGGAVVGGIIGSFVGPLGTAAGAAIGSAIGKFAGSLIGGTANPDELRRRAIRGRLQETGLGEGLNFRSTRGVRSLFDSDFNVDFANNQLAASIIPAVTGLGTLFGGGGKGGDDLTGILANAASEADNLSDAMFNVISIFDQMGISAEDAKNQLTQSFLAGELTLEEFGRSLQSINELSQDLLVPGTGGITDAFAILGKTIEESPASAMSAFRILMNEAAEEGIHDIGELDSFIGKFGVDSQGTFQKIKEIGVNSMEDLQNLSADQLFALINLLTPLANDFRIFFGEVEEGANQIADGFRNAEDAVSDLGSATRSAVNNAIGELGRLENARRSAERNVNQNAGVETR